MDITIAAETMRPAAAHPYVGSVEPDGTRPLAPTVRRPVSLSALVLIPRLPESNAVPAEKAQS